MDLALLSETILLVCSEALRQLSMGTGALAHSLFRRECSRESCGLLLTDIDGQCGCDIATKHKIALDATLDPAVIQSRQRGSCGAPTCQHQRGGLSLGRHFGEGRALEILQQPSSSRMMSKP